MEAEGSLAVAGQGVPVAVPKAEQGLAGTEWVWTEPAKSPWSLLTGLAWVYPVIAHHERGRPTERRYELCSENTDGERVELELSTSPHTSHQE